MDNVPWLNLNLSATCMFSPTYAVWPSTCTLKRGTPVSIVDWQFSADRCTEQRGKKCLKLPSTSAHSVGRCRRFRLQTSEQALLLLPLLHLSNRRARVCYCNSQDLSHHRRRSLGRFQLAGPPSLPLFSPLAYLDRWFSFPFRVPLHPFFAVLITFVGRSR